MKLLLFDGSNVLIRGLMATENSKMSIDGISTSALTVFINTVTKYARELKPTHMAIIWDGAGQRNKTQLNASYKANRNEVPEHSFDSFNTKKQASFSLAHTFCEYANIAQIAIDGLEADEVIAGYWKAYKDSAEIIIVSNDKDYLQLLTDGTKQVRLSSSSTKTEIWDQDTVEEFFNCPVEWVPAVMSITGDVSDNVVGIKGIGTKKAVKMLKESAGDLNKIEDERFIEHKNQILANLALVDLRNADFIPNLPKIPNFSPTAPDSILFDSYVSFLSEWGMKTTLEKVLERKLWGNGV